MELVLTRETFTERSTIGELSVDGEWLAFTLEDKVRDDGVKVPGRTAIPVGRYQVIIDLSTRFKCLMPHILDVPGFEGIRIHKGNTDENTDGCVLLGLTKGKDFIGESKLAFDAFYPILQQGLQNGGTCWITIVNKEV